MGEAVVFCARGADDLSSAEIRQAIETARSHDWKELHAECRRLLARHGKRRSRRAQEAAAAGLEREARALRTRATRLERIDQTRSPGREEALEALGRIEKLLSPVAEPPAEARPRRGAAGYRGRLWVTRPHPGIDRMASAWLIRRFIDPAARFEFSDEVPEKDEAIPYDMFGVELGHRGERVSFETILEEFGLGDAGLERLARIVREVDLKIEPPADPESPTVERLVEGLRATVRDDPKLLEHGIAIFEALYASFTLPAGRA